MGLLLLTWINFISSWISNHTPNKVLHAITYPFPNRNGCTVAVWEWIHNFVPHIIMDVITYPGRNWCQSIFEKGAPGGILIDTHIWIKLKYFRRRTLNVNDFMYVTHWGWTKVSVNVAIIVQKIPCRLIDTRLNSLTQSIWQFCLLHLKEQILVGSWSKYNNFH